MVFTLFLGIDNDIRWTKSQASQAIVPLKCIFGFGKSTTALANEAKAFGKTGDLLEAQKEFGRKYGVSDNAIRKWIKNYNKE